MKRLLPLVPPLLAGLALLAGEGPVRAADDTGAAGDTGCLSCHEGIGTMHPWEPLSCVDCHGGDGGATTKDDAHVQPSRPVPNDERTVPLNYDLAYRRFVNPTDLRVVEETCARCHSGICADLPKSLHGTTAGHLSDGLYENGVTRSREARYAIFPVRDEDGRVPEHAYESLPSIPIASPSSRTDIGDHFADLPRKSCMQCHLWSRGLGVRGRLGMDGWYRSEGCAACHVLYSQDGLTRSADPTVDRYEPGHPVRHELTSRIPTEQCTICHALDANIGMSFRGLAQLPPGVPGGPDVPGTTDRRSQGQFFLHDPAVCPPDVHHERGMHCIDCHGATDVMGDGNVYGFMEHAVAIECASCHGTFTERAGLRNARGETLRHLFEEDGAVWLVGKVDGKKRRVKQVVDVLDKGSPDFSPRAVRAMDPVVHGRLACYTCHGGWSVNFFGFHFDRNESFTQLDILSGRRTPGRVSTNEKIFATFKHFQLGFDSEGHIAPYMVGFSTAGTVRDDEGALVLRHALPVTAEGKSGMTLIHHQLHTVRPAARRCQECHGSPSALGMGSEDFRLFRDLFVAVGDAGLTVCGLDVKNPAQSVALANLALPSRPRGVALRNDPLQGRAQHAYVACRDGAVYVVDLADPVDPKLVGKLECGDARDVEVREGWLLVAAGTEGLVVASLDNPRRPRETGRVRTTEARAVHVDGLHAYVADGPGGLRVVDLTRPDKPALVSSPDPNGDDPRALDCNDVVVHFQYATPVTELRNRTPARNLAWIADGQAGLHVVDVTDPRKPFPVSRPGRGGPAGISATAVAFASNYDIGSEGGDIPSRERDYLYLAGAQPGRSDGLLFKVDVTDPERVAVVGRRRTVDDPRALGIARVYQAPFLRTFAVVAGRGRGDVEICDVTALTPALPQTGVVDGVGPAVGLALEDFPLDRLVGLDGTPLKDVSHPGARLFTREEIARILRVEARER